MKCQYECPRCGDELEVEDGTEETTCPCCKTRLAMDWDAEFTDGRWRDLTQVREVQRAMSTAIINPALKYKGYSSYQLWWKRCTEKGKEYCRKSKQSWRKRNGHKALAHLKVFRALKDGRLKKKPCSVCGSPESEAHHDDYSKPLDVLWFCKLHHRKHHGIPERNLKPYVPKIRGRYNKGSLNPRAKLTIKQVASIRASSLPTRELAAQFGLSRSWVWKIQNRKAW